MSELYNSQWTGAQIDEAIGDVRSNKAYWSSKLDSYTETDPTVPVWAKATNKPSYTASEVGAVPTSRKVNGKALSSDITLSASDVGARPSSWTPSASDVGALPISGGTLTGNLTGKYITGTWLQITENNHLSTASTKIAVLDSSGWVYHRTAAELRDDIGAVPTSRTVNGKALSENITLSASDVGADALGAAAAVQNNLEGHTGNTTVHITAAERTKWNGKSGKAVSFTVTLTVEGWSGNTQNVSNSKFVTSGYAYTVCPAGDSFAGYAEAVIYADDVTTEGKMTFHCSEKPTANLTVNILRTEATT